MGIVGSGGRCFETFIGRQVGPFCFPQVDRHPAEVTLVLGHVIVLEFGKTFLDGGRQLLLANRVGIVASIVGCRDEHKEYLVGLLHAEAVVGCRQSPAAGDDSKLGFKRDAPAAGTTGNACHLDPIGPQRLRRGIRRARKCGRERDVARSVTSESDDDGLVDGGRKDFPSERCVSHVVSHGGDGPIDVEFPFVPGGR